MWVVGVGGHAEKQSVRLDGHLSHACFYFEV